MKIISVRQGFASDHSSTSYEFLAVDKPLGAEDRANVASLSSRADPTKRRVSFIYHADGYDIPGGYEPLLEHYYDVMYSESYGWWALGVAFNAPPAQHAALGEYEFYGWNDLGVTVTSSGERVIVVINCMLTPDSVGEMAHNDRYPRNEYYDDDEECDDEDDDWDEDDGEMEEVDDSEEGRDEEPVAEAAPAARLYDLSTCDDPLLVLLAEVRQELIGGDYRSLYDVFRVYGWEPDAESEAEDEACCPPRPEPEPDGEEAFGELYHMMYKT
ncbi:MAG: hypothetical protein KKI08_10070 [Armatimonadetes bacterium]|nr:hypothetical protein [Armatimonadota bacterium]